MTDIGDDHRPELIIQRTEIVVFYHPDNVPGITTYPCKNLSNNRLAYPHLFYGRFIQHEIFLIPFPIFKPSPLHYLQIEEILSLRSDRDPDDLILVSRVLIFPMPVRSTARIHVPFDRSAGNNSALNGADLLQLVLKGLRKKTDFLRIIPQLR